MPYHPEMAPPPFVVAVVGLHDSPEDDVRTAAWVAGRDVAFAGAWLAVDVGGSVAAAAANGAREHNGAVLGFTSHEYREVTTESADVSIVIRTGLPSPTHAATLMANADAVLAFPGDVITMAMVAAALQRGVPVAQVGNQWPLRPLTPTEVPAWLDEHISRAARVARQTPDPPAPPVLESTGPQRHTPASEFEPAQNTPSSSSTVSDATSSPSPTTPTNEPASTSGTPTA
jgi:hypothetical protein